MNITKNFLKGLLVGLVLLFCAILVIQSIDNVLATHVYIILHLMLIGGVLLIWMWMDFKEIRKQVKEKYQKMDEDFEKERAERDEEFSWKSQEFWIRVAAENEARAAAEDENAAIAAVENSDGNKEIVVSGSPVSKLKVQTIPFVDNELPVYGPPPKPGARFKPSVSKPRYAYGAPPIKRF